MASFVVSHISVGVTFAGPGWNNSKIDQGYFKQE